jgi:cell division protein FtsQ
MASSSNRRSGSSGRSTKRKRVVIGAEETVRVRYRHNEPQVEAERRSRTPRQSSARATSQGSRAGKRLSSAKREVRERRQRSIRLKRIAALCGVAAIVALLAWGVVAFLRAPMFAVDAVEVDGERHHDDATVLEIARIPASATLWQVPTAEIERRLEADPWISDAKIERDFPDTLRITISERVPIAVVDRGGTELWVISSDGHWLGKRSKEDTGLVVVRGVDSAKVTPGKRTDRAELLNAVRVLEGISPELRERVESVSAPSVEETALKTTDDVEIFIGEATQLADKDRIAREILADQKGAVYINVRVTDRPTWRGLEGEPE